MSPWALAAALAVAAALPAHADAAGRWPTRTVRYADHSRSRWDVRTAVALWNQVQSGVRLVPARRGQRPQIRIYASACPRRFVGTSSPTCGFYPPDGRVYLGTRADSGGVGRGMPLAAHEVGHALGLVHGAGCRIMVPNLALVECPGHGFDGCGPTAADGRSLVRLYGGRVRRYDRRGRGCLSFLPFPPVARGTLMSPREPTSAPRRPPDQPIPAALAVQVRNDSSWTWGRLAWGPQVADEVELLTVNAQGARIRVPNNCGDPEGGSIGDAVRRADRPVPPGTAGTFLLRLCPPAEDETIHLRLYTLGRGATLAGRSIVTVRVRGPAAQEPAAAGRRPVASFTAQPAGSGNVSFEDASYDPDGTVVAWSWDFGDAGSPDNTSLEQSPSHTYAGAGPFTVTLTVTDDSGAVSTAATSVTP